MSAAEDQELIDGNSNQEEPVKISNSAAAIIFALSSGFPQLKKAGTHRNSVDAADSTSKPTCNSYDSPTRVLHNERPCGRSIYGSDELNARIAFQASRGRELLVSPKCGTPPLTNSSEGNKSVDLNTAPSFDARRSKFDDTPTRSNSIKMDGPEKSKSNVSQCNVSGELIINDTIIKSDMVYHDITGRYQILKKSVATKAFDDLTCHFSGSISL